MFDLKNFKVQVNSPEESKAIQQLVIDNGGRWANQSIGFAYISYTDKPYLIVRGNIMSYDSGGDEGAYFDSIDLEDGDFDFDVVTIAKQAPMKTIHLFGEDYSESLVRRLLVGKSL